MREAEKLANSHWILENRDPELHFALAPTGRFFFTKCKCAIDFSKVQFEVHSGSEVHLHGRLSRLEGTGRFSRNEG